MIKKRIMNGEIDLYTVSADELEAAITEAVAAAGKIIRVKWMAPEGGGSPPAPANDCPCGNG